jgi:hypothetical protein
MVRDSGRRTPPGTMRGTADRNAPAPAPSWPMSEDDIFAEMYDRGYLTAAQAAEAGHPVSPEGRQRRHVHWSTHHDPDIRAAYLAGRMQGHLEYDADLVQALAWLLGGGKERTIRSAADWHTEQNAKADRRRRADARDPELMAEVARDQAKQAAAAERRHREMVASIPTSEPINDWRMWRDYCSPEVWARVCHEYARAGWPVPGQAPSQHRHRAAA